MSLSLKIEKHLGRKVDFDEEVILINRGNGDYISEWNAPEDQPSMDTLNSIDVTNEEIIVEVQNNRNRAYPSIADQLDQIYHEGIDAWKTTIAAVKAEYPKP